MDIQQFKRLLRKLFHRLQPPSSLEVRNRVHDKTIRAYTQKHESSNFSFSYSWNRWFHAPVFKMGMAAIFIIVSFYSLPFSHTKTLAGHIQPQSGVVKIVRNNETLLVSENLSLKEGDIIQIGHNGKADIIFPDQFQSHLSPRTELTIINQNEIFIKKGEITSETYDYQQFSGDRGFIQSEPGSSFIISISETSEMKIIAQRNDINVFDWKDGEMTVKAGEKINLRTDTQLISYDVPSNLNLSDLQLNSIQAKLVIARTKLLTTIENITSGKKSDSENDLLSAKKSFLSILDVIHASRDMEIQKQIHWESFDFIDVINQMKRKQIPNSMIEEAIALRTLFMIIENNTHNIAFRTQETGMKSFDRFVTLERIFLGSDPEHKKILKDKYVVVFLRKILNHPLRIDQISVMNKEINKIPYNTPRANEFLTRLGDLLPKELSEILQEKIDRYFPL